MAGMADRADPITAVLVPLRDEEGSPRNRRTLYRVLAMVVALAAIAPLLLEADPFGGATADSQTMQVQVACTGVLQQAGRAVGPGTENLSSGSHHFH